MIVVDASVLVPALVDDDIVGTSARNGLSGEQLLAPELADLEVASVLRRLCDSDKLSTERAGQALADLRDLRLRRSPHKELLGRCWEHRHNLTIYDAAYVALAELTASTLLTADKHLAGSPSVTCAVEVLA